MLAMSAERLIAPPPRQRLERLLPMAGFQVSSYGRFWVSTEALLTSAAITAPSPGTVEQSSVTVTPG